MLSAACEVVVIGGSVISVITAWFLTERGLRISLLQEGTNCRGAALVEPNVGRSLDHLHELLLGASGMRPGRAAIRKEALVVDVDAREPEMVAQ